MLRMNRRGLSLLEITMGGTLLGVVGVASIKLMQAQQKASNATTMINQGVLLQQRLAAAARIPEVMQRSAQMDQNMNFCVDVRNDNATNPNCTAANCCNTGLVRQMDMHDANGVLLAGATTPARYTATGELCPPGSPASIACPLEAYSWYSATCPMIPGTVTPQAVCKKTPLTNIKMQFRIQQAANVAIPGALLPFKPRSVASIAGLGNNCADGYTMIGVDSAGLPICVYHTAAQCALGSFLWSYDPQYTTGNFVCRSLASLCPAGYRWQGFDQNASGTGIAANGNAGGWCVAFGVATCAALPNGYVFNVNFQTKTVDCATPAWSGCGPDTLQSGNYSNGAPICTPWSTQLPSIVASQNAINALEGTLFGFQGAYRANSCMARPVRALGKLNGVTGSPVCNNPPNDFNGDGWPDLVVGAGENGGPRVNVISGTDRSTVLANFFAYDPSLRMGIVVGLTDVDGDGYADVLTMPNSPGGGPALGVFFGPNPNRNLHKFVIDTSGNLRTGYSVGP